MFTASKRGVEESAPQRYIELLLVEASQSGADKIVFGEPGDDHARVTLAAALASSGPEWRDSMNEMRALSPQTTGDAPVWTRIDGGWHEHAGFPWYLLHDIVRLVGEMISPDIHGRPGNPVSLESRGEIIQLTLTLALEPNYCYSIALREAD